MARLVVAVVAVGASLCTGAPIKIGMIGDSITAGVCSTAATNGYPAVLQKLLGGNYQVSTATANVAMPGAAVPRAASAWPSYSRVWPR